MSETLKNAIAGLTLIGFFVVSHFLKLNVQVLIRFVWLFAILFHAWILGRRFLPTSNDTVQTVYGGTLFFAILALLQTVWFYTGTGMDSISDFCTVLLAMLAVQICNLLTHEPDEPPQITVKETWTWKHTVSFLLSVAITMSAFLFVLHGAWSAQTTNALRTPWPLLPHGTLLAIALLWLCIPVTGWLTESAWWTACQAAFALFTTTAIAPLLYTLGFGFDGFLHVAGESQILTSGTLNPKPFYYIGQYVFTTWLSRGLALPVESIDRWLVPVACALLIPFSLFFSAKRESNLRRSLWSFGLLLLPLEAFIATTPQSFAYVLGVAALLLSLATAEDVHDFAPLLFAAWSVVVHPLAGVPFFFLCLALLIVRRTKATVHFPYKKVFAWTCALLAPFSVPALFILLSAFGHTPIAWNFQSIVSWTPWQSLLSSLVPWLGNAYTLWPAWTSFVAKSLPFVVLCGAITSCVVSPKEQRTSYILLSVSSILFLVAGAILRAAGDFSFLIAYERGNYADRLTVIATLCLVVASLPAMARLLEVARRRASLLAVFLLVALGAFAAAQTYNALPRNDALVTGHGWSVGVSDIQAVQAIDADANSQPYTVLADQSVSAAAISQLGFKRYNGDVFYYPIPTGGPLYNVFLDMTYKQATRDTAAQAASLGGSKLVYVVVNDYWWNANNLDQTLAGIADKQWSFGPAGGALGTSASVYKFDFSSSTSR